MNYTLIIYSDNSTRLDSHQSTLQAVNYAREMAEQPDVNLVECLNAWKTCHRAPITGTTTGAHLRTSQEVAIIE